MITSVAPIDRRERSVGVGVVMGAQAERTASLVGGQRPLDDLAARVKNEREFHDLRYHRNDRRAGLGRLYDAGSAGHEAFTDAVREAGGGKRVLELGCGTGGPVGDSLARNARSLLAVDISDTGVAAARRRYDACAKAAGSATEVRVEVHDAHALRVPDAGFDLVYGAGILHHLALDAVASEILRVLAPGGRAIFIEPLAHNPVLNLYRKLTPSLRSPDETPLKRRDLLRFGAGFSTVRLRRFDLLSVAGAFLPAGRARRGFVAVARRMDRAIVERLPVLRWQQWWVLIDATK